MPKEASPSIGNTVTRFNDVHASGYYNSAGSVRIRMKLGVLRVYCMELALKDFGRDPRRSESGRASRNFFCEVNNARLCRFPVSQISRNLHTRRGSVRWWILISENISENLPLKGLFSKRQILGDCLQRLRASGRDISETITNLGKSWHVGQPTECWLSICTLGINSKSFPGLQAGYKKRHSWTLPALPSSAADVMLQSHSHAAPTT